MCLFKSKYRECISLFLVSLCMNAQMLAVTRKLLYLDVFGSYDCGDSGMSLSLPCHTYLIMTIFMLVAYTLFICIPFTHFQLNVVILVRVMYTIVKSQHSRLRQTYSQKRNRLLLRFVFGLSLLINFSSHFHTKLNCEFPKQLST